MKPSQEFQIGDRVVYPNHGVGVIEQIGTRSSGFQIEQYYLLHIKSSNLKVMVPFQNVHSVGIRGIVKNAEIGTIFDYLRHGVCNSNQDWKDRYKENCEKMRTGSLMEVAVVLKSLLVLNQTKPLSFREKKMVERARFLLVNEIAMARDVDESEIDDLLCSSLASVGLTFPPLAAAA